MDIHNYKGRLDAVLRSIKAMPICEENKKAIFDFVDSLLCRSLSIARIEHHLQILKYVCKISSKPFEGMASRPSIYVTEFFRKKYEAEARQNLQRAIANLRTQRE